MGTELDLNFGEGEKPTEPKTAVKEPVEDEEEPPVSDEEMETLRSGGRRAANLRNREVASKELPQGNKLAENLDYTSATNELKTEKYNKEELKDLLLGGETVKVGQTQFRLQNGNVAYNSPEVTFGWEDNHYILKNVDDLVGHLDNLQNDGYKINVVPQERNMKTSNEIEQLTKSISVKSWYNETFPDDELGNEINPDITFYDMFRALDTYKDIYALLGVDDSVVRERVFYELDELLEAPKGYCYEQWLLSANRKVEETKDISGAVKVLNYGEVKEFNTRQEAIDFYRDCVYGSEGAERDRYVNILMDLQDTDNDFVYDDEYEYQRYIGADPEKEMQKQLDKEALVDEYIEYVNNFDPAGKEPPLSFQEWLSSKNLNESVKITEAPDSDSAEYKRLCDEIKFQAEENDITISEVQVKSVADKIIYGDKFFFSNHLPADDEDWSDMNTYILNTIKSVLGLEEAVEPEGKERLVEEPEEYTFNTINQDIVGELEDENAFVWLGMLTDDNNLNKIVNGFKSALGEGIKFPINFYMWTGKTMNEKYNLTDNLAYPDDLNILAVKQDNFTELDKLSRFKVATGAHWLKDVVADNEANRPNVEINNEE